MFKTKEELIELFDEEDESGIYVAFEYFKERVEFYKKYRNDTELFYKEQKELCKKIEFEQLDIEMLMASEWRDWLFDYCFGDIE